MSGAELYEHLRDDGAWGATKATAAIVGVLLLISTLVWLWERRKARRINAQQGIEIYPPDRTEQILRDALREDPDDLTRDWQWP
ncbi:hypothetical protein FLW53_09375 [Microbispora sp. SCL1-1]|uniref:hypothetical protein n=1 Tax=unclassified Microbispora TaxID=2614687 RepID=UPI001159723B|nr:MULTISPECIES: hypothetical protein [unclassified Microbispora]NJP24412.1 hypothetical protein [Microbispora sp. CL1-1]TQS14563.1 hypothetical protein FLW53_09375 [Microbispora sp. SCL1-1]